MLDTGAHRCGEILVDRQEDADRRQVLLGDANVFFGEIAQEERPRGLDQDPRTVARPAVGRTRATVLHRPDRGQGEANDFVGAAAVRQVGQKADAARVMLVVAHLIFDNTAKRGTLSFDKRCITLAKR
jgi:hypothetical protein